MLLLLLLLLLLYFGDLVFCGVWQSQVGEACVIGLGDLPFVYF